MGVAFIDTETLGLQARTHAIWEIAIIVPDGPDAGEHLWQQSVRSWLERADPVALDINGFHDRYDESSALGWRESTDRFMRLLEGRHLVGAVPSFDEERLRHQVSIYHGEIQRMPWHYHLIDVEALAVGYLSAVDYVRQVHNFNVWVDPPTDPPSLPWCSDDLSRAIGVLPPEGADRHTALADARWAKAIYEKVMSR